MKKVMLSALLLSLPLLGYAQERFPSPEAAASAFAAAVAGKNETQLTALLGDDWRQFLPPEGADPEAVARFNRDWARRPSHCTKRQYGAPECRTRRLAAPGAHGERGWRLAL
ncbi:probable secreted protein [Salmonella enterica subsp. enterica]|uniref:Probable secreted protein n=1 Tax=Salmonella enterica I TaxID=59201 RepID=A0A3S4FBW3_SALET|nr:probable secreted protein [Salmonella enterica subsp. enterica]